MTYSEKLKNPKWQKKRLEILQRDEFKCTLCKDTETELHVHHEKYTKNPWDAPNEDLKTLCKDCHKFIEYFKKTDFWERDYVTDILYDDRYGKNCFILVIGEGDCFLSFYKNIEGDFQEGVIGSIDDIYMINKCLNGKGTPLF